MLHHCNLDRLVAMWQVINYEDAIFTGTANSTGQYATPKNTAESADSPLKPFFDQNLEFHTSRSVVNITAFGYTYPDMPDWAMTPAARADHVRAQVNALYSRSGNGLGKTWAAAALTNKAVEGTAELKSKNYYTAELVVDRREVPLPATVRLLAGGKAVGHMALLAMPRDGLASFSVPLREMCVGDQNLTDLPLARAAAFLQRNLTVEVRMVRLSDSLSPLTKHKKREVFSECLRLLTSASRFRLTACLPLSEPSRVCTLRFRLPTTFRGQTTRRSLFLELR